MNVDNFVFVAPNEIGRENFHETGQNNKIDFVLVQYLQGLLLGCEAVFPRNLDERQAALARKRFQLAAIGQDEGRFCFFQFTGGHGFQNRFQAMRLPGYHDRHALPARRLCESDFDFHLELSSEFFETRNNCVLSKLRIAPGSLDGHTELAASDLFFESFDVGFLKEEKICDLGNDAGFVFADDGDGGEFFHGWLTRPGISS